MSAAGCKLSDLGAVIGRRIPNVQLASTQLAPRTGHFGGGGPFRGGAANLGEIPGAKPIALFASWPPGVPVLSNFAHLHFPRTGQARVGDFGKRTLRGVPVFDRSPHRLVQQTACPLLGLVDAPRIAGYHVRQRVSILPSDRKTLVMQAGGVTRKGGTISSVDGPLGRRTY